MQTERIIRRKLSDEVQERLLRLISGGDLKPGDAMPSERELMERFGVGRPAIREAISRKPKGHDFDYSRQRVAGQVTRHMSHTGG